MPYGSDHPAPDGWDNVAQFPVRTPGDQHRGQLKMAFWLAALHADEFVHVHGLGWFFWTGTHWAEDRKGMTQRAVVATLQAALAQSVTGEKELRDDVRKSETASGVRGVLELAAAMEPFAVVAEELDSHPNLINTQSGILNLDTGELGPHDAALRMTKITTAGYHPDRPVNEDSAWRTFLRQALPDVEVRDYFQRLVGLSLLGAVREHILPILKGIGGNGKSVAVGTIEHALGTYAYTAESDLFTSAKQNANAASPALMALRGMRFVTVSETERDQPLAESLMKAVTGGDVIRARPLYGKPISFMPSHLAVLVTNHLPRVAGDDEAIWRRLRVIPFDVSFRDNPDTGLAERLRGEADDVLAWAVEGWQEYQRIGLVEPQSVLVATGEYRKASDVLQRFIGDVCTTGPMVHVGHAELLSAWRGWCAESGEVPGTERAFSRAVEEHGYPGRKTMTGKRYQGLALTSEDVPEDEPDPQLDLR